MPHKGGRTYGYRVSDGHSVLTYIPDHCPTVLGPGPEGLGEYHPAALDLAAGADLLIHDAFLLAAEVPAEASFGHAAAEYAAGLGARAGARRVVLAHHKPDRTDTGPGPAGRAVRAPGSPGARTSVRRRRGRDTRSMSPVPSADAIVVGSRPQRAGRGDHVARAGHRVPVYEGADTPGGGCRTAELTCRVSSTTSVPRSIRSPRPRLSSQASTSPPRGKNAPPSRFRPPTGRRAGGGGRGLGRGDRRQPGRDAGLPPAVRPAGARHGADLPNILPFRSVPGIRGNGPLRPGRPAPRYVLARRFRTEEARACSPGWPLTPCCRSSRR